MLVYVREGASYNRAVEECRLINAQLANATALHTLTDDVACWTRGSDDECLAAYTNFTYGEDCTVTLPFACDLDVPAMNPNVMDDLSCDGHYQTCTHEFESCTDFCVDGYDLPLTAIAETADYCCCAHDCCLRPAADWTLTLLPPYSHDGCAAVVEPLPRDDDGGGISPAVIIVTILIIFGLFLIATCLGYRQHQQQRPVEATDADAVTVAPDSILEIPMAKRIESDTTLVSADERPPSLNSNDAHFIDNTPRSIPRRLLPTADPSNSPVIGFALPH